MLEHGVLVCVGSGGVGKTTLAAALGVRGAQLGLRVLILTVDPAKRLATALGLDLSSDQVCKVENLKIKESASKGVLYAAVVDSKKTFDAFIITHSTSPEIATRITKNRLYQQLSTTLSGSQEFTSLERLYAAYESKQYDLVILDTPPTKHAVDFLLAPQKLSRLFDDSILKWFLMVTPSMAGADKKSGLLASLINRGTKTVFKSLEILTGAQFIEELVDFFASVRSIQFILRDRTIAVRNLLTSPKTKFMLITSFDAAKLAEADYMQKKLKSLHYGLAGVIINRAFPIWLHDDVPAGPLGEFYLQYRDFYKQRYALYEKFAASLNKKIRVWRLPEYNHDVHGVADLEELARQLSV